MFIEKTAAVPFQGFRSVTFAVPAVCLAVDDCPCTVCQRELAIAAAIAAASDNRTEAELLEDSYLMPKRG